VVALLVAGCGGGGGGSGPADAGPAIDTVAVGRVTASGSLVVNGITWDTAAASVAIDGSPAGAADLRPGDVVAVAGTLAAGDARGTAVRIDAHTAVRGPVIARGIARDDDSRYATALVIEVLGQYVLVDPATLAAGGIDIGSGAGLAPGTLVEVSGFHSFATLTDTPDPGDPGSTVTSDFPLWRATRIVPAPPGTPLLATGTVTASDPGSHRLTVDRLAVDLATATFTGFGAAGPAAGDRVRVTGTAQLPDGSLVADRVEAVTDPLAGVPPGTDAIVEGFREATGPGAPPGDVVRRRRAQAGRRHHVGPRHQRQPGSAAWPAGRPDQRAAGAARSHRAGRGPAAARPQRATRPTRRLRRPPRARPRAAGPGRPARRGRGDGGRLRAG
jgi:hypothetical protein